ncbi:MAG: type II toxin-antitoxin system VapC family toxin [Candidatus Devosia phytovorans]|uniref:Ribonuclease VapC n=1 Tax=Candidatus Devosia phytovorans TaxID=3121372 RepID=A0AAJ5VWH1_9HYPH|nr:type II toxin-antitoxin system VapC family toxin [Devosia sp.]WEK04683.1 MAG: type II toxin-antitoxin system VapC family toxin [Devosia sp.]
MTYLLDTNVLSEVRRPQPDAAVMAWLDQVDEDRVYLSVISIAEIARGVALLDAGRRRDELAEWLTHDLPARFETRLLTVDERVALTWGRLMGEAKRAGRGLSVMDGWIAAVAIVHELVLVTRNIRDFEGLGIVLLDPWMGKPAGPA